MSGILNPTYETALANRTDVDISKNRWNDYLKWKDATAHTGALLVCDRSDGTYATNFVDSAAGVLCCAAQGSLPAYRAITAADFGTQTANKILAGPTTGSAATPTFRSLVVADLPTVTVPFGGTGLTTLTAHALYVGAGASAPTALGLGTTTTVLHGNASGDPTWGAVSLTADVSGILPTANGGTGIAYFTAAGPTVARVYTFPDAACSVLTTNAAVTVAQGGTGLATLTAHALYVGNGASNPTALAVGTTGQYLRGASGADPIWSTLALPNAATTGDLVIATGTNVLGSLADVATGQVLISGGVGVAPSWSASPTLTSLTLGATGLIVADAGVIGFTSDTFLKRMAANALGQVNGTTAQEFRVYGTTTGPAYLSLFGNMAGGSPGIQTNASNYLYISPAVDLIIDPGQGSGNYPMRPRQDNATDLGATGQRWRTGYLGTSLVTPAIGAAAGTLVINGSDVVPNTDNNADVGATAKRWRNAVLSQSLSVGTNPASTGALRLANLAYAYARNAANSADYRLIGLNASNQVAIDSDAGGTIFGGAAVFGSTDANALVVINNSFSPASSYGALFRVSGTLSALAGNNGYVFLSQGTINKAGSGNHGRLAGFGIFPPVITAGAATVTDAATVYIDGPTSATVSGANYAILVNSGNSLFGGVVAATYLKTTTATIAAGGGAAPTFTTIGGSGPATAAQNGWLPLQDSTGATIYVPVWK